MLLESRELRLHFCQLLRAGSLKLRACCNFGVKSGRRSGHLFRAVFDHVSVCAEIGARRGHWSLPRRVALDSVRGGVAHGWPRTLSFFI